MLTFESPFYEIEGVIVFRDHASLNTFHYLAGPPRLTRNEDNKPQFLLLKYAHALDSMTTAAAAPTRDQLGGAFLMFGVDCGVDETTKNSIQNKLTAMLPKDMTATLVPVLYTKGKVSVVALDKQQGAEPAPDGADAEKRSKFVRGILGSATPSLMQDQRAIFSISLDPDAAVLVEKAYESGLSPIGVMYELDFAGLRPALSVKAKVNMSAAYESFKAGLQIGVGSGGGSGAGGTAPPATTPPTTTPPTTTPPTTPPTTTPPTTTPGTTPGGQAGAPAHATPAPAGGTTPAPTAGGQSSGTQMMIQADLSIAIESLKQTGAIQIEIIRQQEGASIDQMEKNAMTLLQETLLKEFFKPALTGVPAGGGGAAGAATAATAASQQMMATSGNTNTGKAGGGGGTSVQIGLQLQYKKSDELKEATFDYSVQAPETRTHAPNGFFSALLTDTEKTKHIRAINLDDPFFKVIEVDISTTAEFQAIDLKSLVVDMEYGGKPPSVAPVVDSAQFTEATKDPRRFQAFVQDKKYAYRYRLDYKFGQSEDVFAQKSSYQTPWRNTTTRALVLHPPEDIAMLRVFVEPGVVDWDLVEKIATTLVYDDPANHFHAERTFLVEKATPRQTWQVRLSNPLLRTYTVKTVWHMKDHREITGKPRQEDVAHFYVGDPFADRLTVTIDPRVNPANVLRINVELEYEDRPNDFRVRKLVEIVGPQFTTTSATIPLLNPDRREYSCRVSVIKASGQAEDREAEVTDRPSIVITEGGLLYQVDVTLLGNMATAGVDALQLDLQCQPPDGDAPVVETHLFLPGEAVKVSKTLLRKVNTPEKFQYRVKVFAGAREIETDWIPQTGKSLPLPLARLLNP